MGATLTRTLICLRQRRRIAAAVLLAVTGMAGWGWRLVTVESGLDSFNAMAPGTVRDRDRITKVWGTALARTQVVVEGETLDDALARAEHVRTALKAEERRGVVHSLGSIVELLPSTATQRRNRERWRRFWGEGRLESYQSLFEKLMRQRGLHPELTAQFWQHLRETGAQLGLEELAGTPLAWILGSWVSSDPAGRAWVRTECVLAPQTPFEEGTALLRRIEPEAAVVNASQMLRRLSATVYKELLRIAGVSLLLVLAVVVALYRDLRRSLLLLAVVITTLVWSIGFLGLASVRITIMNSLLAVFVFGLTIDYGVFLLHINDSCGPAADETASAVLFSAATTLIGFGALLAAHHPALQSIGATAFISVACGLVAATTLTSLARSHANPSQHRPPAADRR